MIERIDEVLRILQVERRLSPNTISAYRNDLLQFSDFLEVMAAREGKASIPLQSVDKERLGGYFLHLRDRGYSSASVARKTAALRALYQYLWRKGEVTTDPTAGLNSPEVKKPLPRTIAADEVRLLLAFTAARDTPEGKRDHAMLRLLSATGMRVGELVTLDVDDIDLANARVRVVGRANRERRLPIDAATVASLKDYLEDARPYLTRNTLSERALVVNQRGLRLTRQGFWLVMKGIVREAGLPPAITPHVLRHSFAKNSIGEGVELEELRQLLGHASIATTQIYTQVAGQSPDTPVPSSA
jgi:integrase/recombinase XerD